MNHSRKNKKIHIPGLMTKVTLSKVIIEEKRSEINQEVDKLSRADRGTRVWLQHYKKGLHNVTAGLDDEEIERFEEIRKRWDKEGLPSDVQAR